MAYRAAAALGRQAGVTPTETLEYGQNNAAENAITNIGAKIEAGLIGALKSNREDKVAKNILAIRDELTTARLTKGSTNTERKLFVQKKIKDLSKTNMRSSDILKIQEGIKTIDLKQEKRNGQIILTDPITNEVVSVSPDPNSKVGPYTAALTEYGKQHKRITSTFTSTTAAVNSAFSDNAIMTTEANTEIVGEIQKVFVESASVTDNLLTNRQNGAFFQGKKPDYRFIDDLERDKNNKSGTLYQSMMTFRQALTSQKVLNLLTDPKNAMSVTNLEQIYKGYTNDILNRWTPEVVEETGITITQLNEFFGKEAANIEKHYKLAFDKGTYGTATERNNARISYDASVEALDDNDFVKSLSPQTQEMLKKNRKGLLDIFTKIGTLELAIGQNKSTKQAIREFLSPVEVEKVQDRIASLEDLNKLRDTNGVIQGAAVQSRIQRVLNSYAIAGKPQLVSRFRKAINNIIEIRKKENTNEAKERIESLERTLERFERRLANIKTARIDTDFGN
jgi:hypothetical protein